MFRIEKDTVWESPALLVTVIAAEPTVAVGEIVNVAIADEYEELTPEMDNPLHPPAEKLAPHRFDPPITTSGLDPWLLLDGVMLKIGADTLLTVNGVVAEPPLLVTVIAAIPTGAVHEMA